MRRLLRVISEAFDVNTEDMNEDTELSEFVSDDFGLLHLIESLQTEYGVVLADTDAEDWKSLADVLATLGDE